MFFVPRGVTTSRSDQKGRVEEGFLSHAIATVVSALAARVIYKPFGCQPKRCRFESYLRSHWFSFEPSLPVISQNPSERRLAGIAIGSLGYLAEKGRFLGGSLG
jgi:hypothetical protein